jgi:DNA-binding NarL/FixJ family response regulator
VAVIAEGLKPLTTIHVPSENSQAATGSARTSALNRVAAGGTALDPEVVSQLMNRHDPLDALTPREHEVLHLMAQGHENVAIARQLVVTERAVAKHVGNIFRKLDLPHTDSGNRRVLAVLAYVNS